jgi:cephalosporin-C deacetylase
LKVRLKILENHKTIFVVKTMQLNTTLNFNKMKNTTLCIALFCLLCLPIQAQNFLSPIWKISSRDTIVKPKVQFQTDAWPEVNLLMSWERQGYFWHSGKCCMVNNFYVPNEFAGAELSLELCLQCNVGEIFVNGNYIGGNLPNEFWTNRDRTTKFTLPKSIINMGKANQVVILVSDLSYTGGQSHNYCRIGPDAHQQKSDVEILVPTTDHFINDKNAAITLKYNSRQSGQLMFMVISDMHDTLVKKNFDVAKGEGTILYQLANDIVLPGFYECVAILNNGTFEGDVEWLALDPEKIDCKNNTVPNFNSYWEGALNELKGVPPGFSLHKVDSLSTGKRDGYVVEMKSLNNIIIRGYYFVPRAAGKHAAVLHVPGYSYGFQYLGAFINSTEDVAELALCVRGHGISADVFNPGFGIPGVWGYMLCDKNEVAYRAIYMDCVRAVEFLMSRPEIDSSRIGVMGGSQGGGLTLATAGLCKNKIKACAYFDPFPCDMRDQLKIRTICNVEIQNYLNYYNNPCTFNQALDVQDLIDTKGFAGQITCPVFFATALFDDDCPPHLGFAAYNLIKTPKQFKIYPGDSHLGESDPYGELFRFLKKELNF